MKIAILRSKQNNPFKAFFDGLLLFLYIYEFNFVHFGLPTFITSRRIAIAILALLVLKRSILPGSSKLHVEIPQKEHTGSIIKISLLQCFLLIYVLFIYLFIGKGTGEMVSNSIIRLLFFGIVPIFLFYVYFDNLDQFMRAVLFATLLQAIIIIICLASSSFQTRLDRIFAFESKYVALHRQEYAGGLACITAPGALKFSMGLIACAYFLLKKKRSLCVALYLFLSLMATLVARTGVFVAGTGLIVILLYFVIEERNFHIFWIVLSIAIIVGIAIMLLSYFNLWSFLANRLSRFEKLSGGLYEGFFDNYLHEAHNHIPGLSKKTIIGTGITSGESGNGVYINADGGFLRLYVAFGLPLCVAFYTHFVYHVVRQIRLTKNKFAFYALIFFSITFLIAEIKEYTLYSQYMVCLFFAIVTLAGKQVNQNSFAFAEEFDEKL